MPSLGCATARQLRAGPAVSPPRWTGGPRIRAYLWIWDAEGHENAIELEWTDTAHVVVGEDNQMDGDTALATAADRRRKQTIPTCGQFKKKNVVDSTTRKVRVASVECPVLFSMRKSPGSALEFSFVASWGFSGRAASGGFESSAGGAHVLRTFPQMLLVHGRSDHVVGDEDLRRGAVVHNHELHACFVSAWKTDGWLRASRKILSRWNIDSAGSEEILGILT